jgi:hypothetical protein
VPEVTDPTFYRSPAAAIAAPAEKLAYVVAFDPAGAERDAMTVVDCDAESSTYARVVGWTELPTGGNELHHFGWNACSSALCHEGHSDAGALERRYLIAPGVRSSRTYVLDTKPDPRQPRVVRTIEPEELAAKAGYSRPHTVHTFSPFRGIGVAADCREADSLQGFSCGLGTARSACHGEGRGFESLQPLSKRSGAYREITGIWAPNGYPTLPTRCWLDACAL